MGQFLWICLLSTVAFNLASTRETLKLHSIATTTESSKIISVVADDNSTVETRILGPDASSSLDSGGKVEKGTQNKNASSTNEEASNNSSVAAEDKSGKNNSTDKPTEPQEGNSTEQTGVISKTGLESQEFLTNNNGTEGNAQPPNSTDGSSDNFGLVVKIGTNATGLATNTSGSISELGVTANVEKSTAFPTEPSSGSEKNNSVLNATANPAVSSGNDSVVTTTVSPAGVTESQLGNSSVGFSSKNPSQPESVGTGDNSTSQPVQPSFVTEKIAGINQTNNPNSTESPVGTTFSPGGIGPESTSNSSETTQHTESSIGVTGGVQNVSQSPSGSLTNTTEATNNQSSESSQPTETPLVTATGQASEKHRTTTETAGSSNKSSDHTESPAETTTLKNDSTQGSNDACIVERDPDNHRRNITRPCKHGGICFKDQSATNRCFCTEEFGGVSCHVPNPKTTNARKGTRKPAKSNSRLEMKTTSGSVWSRHFVDSSEKCEKICMAMGSNCRSFNYGRVGGKNICETLQLAPTESQFKSLVKTDRPGWSFHCCY